MRKNGIDDIDYYHYVDTYEILKKDLVLFICTHEVEDN